MVMAMQYINARIAGEKYREETAPAGGDERPLRSKFILPDTMRLFPFYIPSPHPFEPLINTNMPISTHQRSTIVDSNSIQEHTIAEE